MTFTTSFPNAMLSNPLLAKLRACALIGLALSLGYLDGAQPETISIAYVSKGGLWLRRGPVVKKLISGAEISAPRFSYDASLIAFRQKNAIAVVDVISGLRTNLGAPAIAAGFDWAPNENAIAVWNISGLHIYYKSDSWKGQVIVKAGPQTVPLMDAVFAGADRILISGRKPGSTVTVDHGVLELVSSLDGTHQIVLTANGDGFIPLGWAPGPNLLLFWNQPSFSSSIQADGLSLYGAAPSPQQENPRAFGEPLLTGRGLVSLAPSGMFLAALTSGTGLGRETWAEHSLIKIDLQTAHRTQLSNLHTSALNPAWSSDGDQLAYIEAPAGTASQPRMEARKLYTVRSDGTNRLQITTDSRYRDEHPVWISSEEIVFCRLDGANRVSLWHVNTRTLKLIQIEPQMSAFSKDDAYGYYGYRDWGEYMDVKVSPR